MFCEVSKEIFDRQSDEVFGAVAVRGLDNKREVPAVQKMLEDKGEHSINPIADLGNAVALKYQLPISAFDIYTFLRPDGTGRGTEDAGFELSTIGGDAGQREEHLLTAGQREEHQITENTTGVLFTIEGSASEDRAAIEKALKDFVELIANYYVRSGHSTSVETGIVDKDNRRFEF